MPDPSAPADPAGRSAPGPSDAFDGYTISDDPDLLDLNVIHTFLSQDSYWAQGVSREIVERSVRHSLCFGVYHQGAGGEVAQVGFARAVTDRATYAYLADVFILPAHRWRGLSKRLMATILAHPELQGLRRWALATGDAHGLYRQFGFEEVAKPRNRLERPAPDSYR